MVFQLRELAIPVTSGSPHDAWPVIGSTCRKGGSTCVARGTGAPHDARHAELEMVRRQILETVTGT
jgi:hypothetical protein